MLGMGLALVPDDFERIFKTPRAIIIGLANQLVFLPVIGYVIAVLFDLGPVMSVGLVLLALCPGGATSNLITHASKGDTALSVSLTAITSVVTVFTIPIFLSIALTRWMGNATPIELPVFETIGKIMAITLLPVGIGMLIRQKKEAFARKMEMVVRMGSIFIFVLIVVGIIVSKWDLISENFAELSGATITLNLVTMFLGYTLAMLFQLKIRQAVSISIESGIQNGTLAIVIATSIIGNEAFAIPAGIYSLVMFISGGAMIVLSHSLIRSFGDKDIEPDAV